MKTLKRPEELVRVPHIKARTIILYEKDLVPVRYFGSKLDRPGGTSTRELPCITDQIANHKLQKAFVTRNLDVRLYPNVHNAVRVEGLQIFDNVIRHRGEVDRLVLHFAARDAGKLENIVDHLRHLAA